MLFPALYNEKNMFDDFDDAFFPMMKHDHLFGKNASRIMRTDVRETATTYEFDIDLPGFKKEEINASLKDGYLTISASKGVEKEDKNDKGHFLRRERMTGSCSRSYYVGDGITEKDVSAKFENGILQISIPKKEAKEEEQRAITIQ